jgi:hypothetical protein
MFGMLPRLPVVEDTAAVVEVNRYYDEDGRQVFTQLIFWDWLPEESAFRVFAWRLVKSPDELPMYDWWRDCYVTQFVDGHLLRRVRSQARRDTWTQYDPELFDRQFLPQQHRRGLAGLEKTSK